ncbi:DUF4232 domain-containing protein [Micromonospora costi]|uniref:DUF4232 domain-containing protein n=1 Tax=Micromonospora costi TaxID=1530042 RepID=UPI0033D2DE01
MTPRPVRLRFLLSGLPLVAALPLTACTSASGSPAPTDRLPAPMTSPTEPASAACPASGVLIRSTGSDAAMGLRALGLELVNCGTAPYELNGYPVLTVRDEQRQPIRLRVVEGAKGITSGFDTAPRPLTLLPGDRATAVVLWRNTFTDSTGAPANGEYLDVAPAAGQPVQGVDPDGPVDLGNTGRIGVSAWKRADPTTPAQPPAPSAPSGAPSVVTTPDSRL